MTLEPVMAKFDEYLSPKKNITYLRFRFFSYNQADGQTIDEFVTELKARSQHCEFGTLQESLIRDKIVLGVYNKKVQERLLRESELSLDQAVSICRAAEEIKLQTKEMQSQNKQEGASKVDYVKSKKKLQYKKKPQAKLLIKDCTYCGSEHTAGDCPAYGQTCSACHKKNHFKKVCKLRKPKSKKKSVKAVKVNSSSSTSSEDTDEDWYIGSIEVEDDNKNNDKPVPELIEESDDDQEDDNDSDDEIVDELWVNAIETDCKDWNTILCLNKTEVEFKLDTGSQANIITKTEFLKVKNHGKIHPTNAKLIAYDGSRINVVGKCVLRVSRGKNLFPRNLW